MRHKRVVVSRYGGPEVITVIDEEVPSPSSGQVLVKVLAAGVSLSDVLAREGVHPEAPRVPYTPGWDLVVIVDELGSGVTGFAFGQMAAAMPIHEGYAQYVYVPHRKLVLVPPELDPAEAVAVVLNYFGRLVAGVVLGVIIVTAANASLGRPACDLCWYWTNSSRTHGYWDYCY